MSSLVKAQLIELVAAGESWQPGSKKVTVQFNPPTLKVSYANQAPGGDQPGGSPKQFTVQSSTKMSVELWFDTTDSGADVRERTKEVSYFFQPKETQQNGKPAKIPPRTRFLWGSFLFDGVVETMEESLEFFSEAGIPLRASVTISLAEQSFQFTINPTGAGGGAGGSGAPPPIEAARAGDTLQSLAQRANPGSDWRAIAEANGIDNPRSLPPGSLIRV